MFDSRFKILASAGMSSLALLVSTTAVVEARWELEDSDVRLLITGSDGVVQTVREIFEPRQPGGDS